MTPPRNSTPVLPVLDMDGSRLPAVAMPPESALWSKADEEYLLAAMMSAPVPVCAVIDQQRFDPADLYRDSHRTLYAVIRRMLAQGQPVSMVDVVEYLHARKMGEACGGLSFVSGLPDRYPGASLAIHYLQKIQRFAAQRQMLRTCLQTIAAIGDGESPAEIQRASVSALAGVSLPGATDRLVTFGECGDATIQSANNQEAREAVWPTGIRALDRVLDGGVTPGRLYIFGGRPKHGKSTLLLNVLAGLASNGHRTHLVSLEMTSVAERKDKHGRPIRVARDLAKKLTALASGVDSRRVTDSPERQQEDQYRRVMEGALSLQEWTGTIDDTAGRTLAQIEAQARRVKAQFPDLEVLAVDHAGLVRGLPGESRTETMSAVSNGLKILAKDLDIAVLLCAQINREAVAKEFPTVDHLKQSGSLEEDADVALLVLNPMQAKMEPTEPSLWVSVAINRHGPSEDLWLEFDPASGRLGDTIPSPIPAAPSKSRRRAGSSWAEED